MKKIYLFLLIATVAQFSIAQTDQSYEKLKKRMWEDPDFKSIDIVDKWKNESAVILAKSYDYEVRKEVFLNYIYENIYLHKRIKLLDKSAVNEFSELSFENDYKNFSFWSSYELKDVSIGIKVIKPSGKENIIDLKEAVLKEIKEGYNKQEYKKIAIPDLEIGDIIDYFYVVKNTYVEQYMKILDPVFYLLVEQYPIVSQKFNVRVMRQMYFNSKSVNGAPQLMQTEKDDETYYSFVDKNREKSSSSLWAYPFRLYPTLKFQAFFIKAKALNVIDFMGYFLKDKKSNNSDLDLANIDVLVKLIYNTQALFDVYLISETKNYLSSNFDKKTPSDTIAKYAYYYMRQKAGDYGHNSLCLNLSAVLIAKKIRHDLVITIPNSIGDISELILPKEMSYLLRIKGSPDYFIGDFSPASNFKSIDSDYQGNNAFAVSNPKMESKPKTEKIIIPIDKPSDNLQTMILRAKFSSNKMDSLQISIEKSVKGIAKIEDIPYFVTKTDYLDEVTKGLNKEKKEEKRKSSKQIKKDKEKLQLLEQQQADCALNLKNYFKSEYGEGDDFKLTSFSVKNIGLWDTNPDFQYNASFTIGSITKKMGPNYVISIGKLVTRQLELSKKDIERIVDIYAPYPRIYNYKIVLEIPLGYKVKGLDKLNVNITNPTGGFTGKAEVVGNELIINVNKQYLHNFEKVGDWSKMVNFIEAAYNFTQQNILLEKN